jgi:heme o synthase
MVGYIVAFTAVACALTLFGPASYTYLVVMAGLGLFWLWRAVKGFRSVDDVRWAGQLFGFSLLVLTVFSFLLATDAWLP